MAYERDSHEDVMDALDMARARHFVRRYRAESVDRDVIAAVVDAARSVSDAASRCDFVAVTSVGALSHIASLTHDADHLAEAPVCVAVLAHDSELAMEEGGAAIAMLLVAARARGLAASWVSADRTEYEPQLRELLEVPSTHRVIGLIGLGWPNGAPRASRPLEEVLHWDTFRR